MDFKTPKIEDYALYKPLLECGEFTFENSFLNAVMWGEKYNYNYALLNNEKTLVIRLTEESENIYFLPIGDAFFETLDEIVEECGGSALFCVSEGERLEKLRSKYLNLDLIPIENNFEYIYKCEDLALLVGKKYHQKRNHISSFLRNYNYRFEELSADNIHDIIELTKKWAEEREECDDILTAELAAIEKVIYDFDKLNIIGGILYVDDTAVAYTFGQQLNEDIFDVNTEKALSDYKGAYAVINNEFVKKKLYPKYKFINREDDLGIEGLRKAKLSYYPEILLKKYLVRIEKSL